MNTRPLPPATTLRGRWLIVARVAWVAVAVLTFDLGYSTSRRLAEGEEEIGTLE
jgi:hypothetical protein